MRQSLTLSLLVCFVAAAGSSPQSTETFGDWSPSMRVEAVNTAANDM